MATKKKASPAQIAARKLFAERARNGTLSKRPVYVKPTSKKTVSRKPASKSTFAVVTRDGTTEAEGLTRAAAEKFINNRHKDTRRIKSFWLIIETKKNPATRATVKARSTTRTSQATGKKPTKRLVARRVATKKAPAGYFANPVKKTKVYSTTFKVEEKSSLDGKWVLVAQFSAKLRALEYAQAYGRANPKKYVRVIDPK